MQQVFVESEAIENRFVISGDDAHHLLKAVRIKTGEEVRVSTPSLSFICSVEAVENDSLTLVISKECSSSELKNKIYLFQAIPKGDRFEGIIEKCVELGVYEIIPVEMKNCIVKLDDKKKASRIKRYQTIADTAAKQSKRSILPQIKEVMTYKEALAYARKNCSKLLLPYECASGMESTITAIDSIKENDSIAVFIGPEGGFDPSEIEMASGFEIISLGRRILRTDTASICCLSMLMLKSEEF
ncbi:MAG: 16S rRNA (uracil(1498)-N(3))-methyltransferase [Pseudobutyrivibrio sp.]|nr:16S rRNA (uracil(1498)-N(3))-methyltransferase [Pseudobutyrivibrio sp.]